MDRSPKTADEYNDMLFTVWRHSRQAGGEVKRRAFWAPPMKTPPGQSGRMQLSAGRWASSDSVPFRGKRQKKV